ncbi:MAG: hypothetical protein LUD02_09320 [Tannerellaceae bacterium]|nr:hypothetical protein [Tannerellaceae bacterium]
MAKLPQAKRTLNERIKLDIALSKRKTPSPIRRKVLSHKEKVSLLEEAERMCLTTLERTFKGLTKEKAEAILQAEASVRKLPDNGGESWEIHYHYEYTKKYSSIYPQIVMLPVLCFNGKGICDRVHYFPDIESL